MIPKTSDLDDVNKQRPIALLNTIVKCFTQCVGERLYVWAEENGVIPEAQAGFRRGRGCRDNIFVLQALIGLKLQFPKGKLFCAFVDYRDAFGSLPHEIIWYVLSRLGIRGNILDVLVSLYDAAKVAIRTTEGTTEFFDVCRGILQGDSCSPLIFSLFLAGLEEYIRGRGFSGVNVDGENEILTLCFADDLCILGFSKVDIQHKLQALLEYSESMGLAINPSKTKVVCFSKRGGMHVNQEYEVGDDVVKGASEYVYLGIPFSSSGVFVRAAQHFKSKALSAWGAARQILVRGGCQNWEPMCRIQEALVESVLLYNAEIWSLRYFEELEKVQTSVIKSALLLPRGTPGYLLRLETGRQSLGVKVFDRAIAWMIKILEMPTNRYPRICLEQLIRTVDRGSSLNKFNWAAQIKGIICSIGFGSVWEKIDCQGLRRHRKDMVNSLRTKHFYEDLGRMYNSSYSTLYCKLTPPSSYLKSYLNSEVPLHAKRILVLLRLSNCHIVRVWTQGEKYEIDQGKLCVLCSGKKLETLSHIFCECPELSHLRLKFFGFRRLSVDHFIINLLSGRSDAETKMLSSFFLLFLCKRKFKKRLLEEADLDLV